MIDGVLIKNLSQAFTLFREVRLFDKSTYLVSKFKEIAKKKSTNFNFRTISKFST